MKFLFYHTLSMVGVKVDPSPYKCIVNLYFLKLYNLWLIHLISSKLWGNAQDYGLDGYYKIQVAKGNRSTCAWKYKNYENPIVLCETQTKFLSCTETKLQ